MKTKSTFFAFSSIALVAVLLCWLSSANSPGQGQAANNDDQINKKLDKIIALLEQGKATPSMIQVELPLRIDEIFNSHLHPDEKGRLSDRDLHRDDFKPEELRDLDKFLKDALHKEDVKFDLATVSDCGACNTGSTKGYNLYIPLPGGGGVTACATCK